MLTAACGYFVMTLWFSKLLAIVATTFGITFFIRKRFPFSILFSFIFKLSKLRHNILIGFISDWKKLTGTSDRGRFFFVLKKYRE